MHAAHALFSAGVVVASVSVGLARSAGAKPLPILAVLSGVVIVAAVAIGASRHQSAGGHDTSASPASPGKGTSGRRTPCWSWAGSVRSPTSWRTPFSPGALSTSNSPSAPGLGSEASDRPCSLGPPGWAGSALRES